MVPLTEIQQACQQRKLPYSGKSRYEDDNVSTTADGQVKCGTEYGTCMDEGYTWLQVYDSQGSRVLDKRYKRETRLSFPRLAPGGDVVFVRSENDRSDLHIVEIPVNTGLLRQWRGEKKLFSAENLTALQPSSDGRSLAVAQEGNIQLWDRKHCWWTFTPNPRPLATVADNIQALDFLSDGSLLAFPAGPERVWTIDAKTGAVQRFPRKQYDPEGWRDIVHEHASWLPPDYASWLVDDEGRIPPFKKTPYMFANGGSEPYVRDKMAIVTQEATSLHVWEWNGTHQKAAKIAAIPSSAANYSFSTEWSAISPHLMVQHAANLSIVNVTNGNTHTLPDVARSVRIGSHYCFPSLRHRNLTLWDGKIFREIFLESSHTTLEFEHLQVEPTNDASHFVVCTLSKGMKQYDVHILTADGTPRTVIPGLEHPQVKGNTLHFAIGGVAHTLAIPDGLDTLKEQPWYANPNLGGLFGNGRRDSKDLRIERHGNTLDVGGVKLEIGSTDPNSAASHTGVPPSTELPRIPDSGSAA